MSTQTQPKSPRDSFFINDKKKRKRKPKKPRFRNRAEDDDSDQENPQPKNVYPTKKFVNNTKKINRNEYSSDEPEEMNNKGFSDDDDVDFYNRNEDSEKESEEDEEDDVNTFKKIFREFFL